MTDPLQSIAPAEGEIHNWRRCSNGGVYCGWCGRDYPTALPCIDPIPLEALEAEEALIEEMRLP